MHEKKRECKRGAYRSRTSISLSKSDFDKLRDIERIFDVSLREIKRFIRSFRSEMEKGLRGQESSLAMLPTYVEKPTGEEKGNFLAIDLGGTNLRVAALKLKGERKTPSHISEKFAFKNKLKSSGDALFDFVADRVKNFIIKHGMDTAGKNDIGFTFSFPVKQSKISSGVLIRWTKGFSAKGVEGKDVVGLLNDSLKRKGLLGTKAVAIINDTVATLVAKSYEDPDCDVGVILGTGTNACYSENDGSVINIEWGNFNKLRLTPYDKKLDKSSENPGEQTLEKMISGMYLGKLAEIIMEGMMEKKLFGHIPEIVSRRAARLAAAATAAVITKIDARLKNKHTIAIDGSLYEKEPGFSENFKKAIKEIFGKQTKKINLEFTKDASSKGAAIVAAGAAG